MPTRPWSPATTSSQTRPRGVDEEFQQALGTSAPAGAADTLISDPDDPADTPWNATSSGPSCSVEPTTTWCSWPVTSAPTTPWRPTSRAPSTPRSSPRPAPTPASWPNTLVLSAGCHSGYNIVDDDSVLGLTETADWTQRMAQQHAVLVGGTGYQYGDSDFLEYSERLYLDLAKRLHEGRRRDGRAGRRRHRAGEGEAGLPRRPRHRSGIDQKALLEATLYGLPMTGFAAPGRTPVTAGDAADLHGPHHREPGAHARACGSPTRPSPRRRPAATSRSPTRAPLGPHLAGGSRRRDRPAGCPGPAQAGRGRHRAGPAAPRRRLPQRRVHRRHGGAPVDGRARDRGLDPQLDLRVGLLLPAAADHGQLLRRARAATAGPP